MSLYCTLALSGRLCTSFIILILLCKADRSLSTQTPCHMLHHNAGHVAARLGTGDAHLGWAANLDDGCSAGSELPPANKTPPVSLQIEGCLVLPRQLCTNCPATPHSLHHHGCLDLLHMVPGLLPPPASLPSQQKISDTE